MKLVFATGNKGKLREAREILGPEYEILTPAEVGVFDEPEENGLCFQENSLIKARYIYDRTGLDCFADDSGLCVDCLGGRPGIYSARYADTVDSSHNFDDNITKVLSEMSAVLAERGIAFDDSSSADRTAHFSCVATLIIKGEPHFFEGRLDGSLISERRGSRGFGYDPVFVPDGGSQTLSELEEECKNSMSHRGEALTKMAKFLKES